MLLERVHTQKYIYRMLYIYFSGVIILPQALVLVFEAF